MNVKWGICSGAAAVKTVSEVTVAHMKSIMQSKSGKKPEIGVEKCCDEYARLSTSLLRPQRKTTPGVLDSETFQKPCQIIFIQLLVRFRYFRN
jgi:hypothetical protein